VTDPGQTSEAVALGPDELTDSVTERIEGILASARESAETIREQAAAATASLIAETQATVDRDADRIKRDVEARAAQYLAECHRRVDAFAEARVKRLHELADALIDRTERLEGRFDEAFEVKRQLDVLIEALGQAAEQTAREVRRPGIALPSVAQFSGEQRGRLRAAPSLEAAGGAGGAGGAGKPDAEPGEGDGEAG
jgi:DNA anti-recombination protein RmuC